MFVSLLRRELTGQPGRRQRLELHLQHVQAAVDNSFVATVRHMPWLGDFSSTGPGTASICVNPSGSNAPPFSVKYNSVRPLHSMPSASMTCKQ